MAFVSVIIPCYNAHQHLQAALDSIYRQTFTDIEIIVVNDGSTDPKTTTMLASLGNRVNVLDKPNGGLASARNVGISHSTGEIIVTLDSDDLFEKSFIEKAVHLFKANPTTGVVSSYVQEFGTSKKTWRAGATDDFSFLTENRIVAC
ncbi:MAG TPA: glycosyltransferase family A protein, partial [Chitinophagaceae bacterium]|nr:glycosyltransferase family A protein [Chitinophagaceae bacterium]